MLLQLCCQIKNRIDCHLKLIFMKQINPSHVLLRIIYQYDGLVRKMCVVTVERF